MATLDGIEIPRGLKKRGRTWYISRVLNGRLVRITTGCSDLEAAIATYRKLERQTFADDYSEWWMAEIENAKRGHASYLAQMLSRSNRRDARKNRQGGLTMSQLIALAEQSKGVCAVSGIRFSPKVKGKRMPFLPSLDRIDSTKGYTLGNCQFVCLIVNYAMSDFGEESLRILARALAMKELRALNEAENPVRGFVQSSSAVQATPVLEEA